VNQTRIRSETPGEILDRAAKEVRLAATFDDEPDVFDVLRHSVDEELPRLLMKDDKVYVELTGSEALPTPTSTGLMEWLKRSRAIPGRTQTVDVRPIMASLRTVKDAGELALMKKAAEASMAARAALRRSRAKAKL